MIVDSLTTATIIVAVLIFIILFAAIIYSHFTNQKNMKILARNTILMNSDDEIRDLCNQIMSIDSSSCPLLDGDVKALAGKHPDELKTILRNKLKSMS